MSISEFLFILVVIIVFAKALGELCQMIGQPAVLGELLAGIIIGPGALALIQDTTFFDYKGIFYLLAEIGVLLLLFEVGLETELSELIKLGKKSVLIGVSGIVFPFVFAFLFCYLIGETTMESIMIAAALTATSIGITSKVFEELNFLQSQEAKIVLGAAIVDDILALAILGVVTTMATTNEKLSMTLIFSSVLISVLFLAFALVLGRIFVKHLLLLLEKMSTRGIMLIGSIAFAFTLAFIASKVGSSIIIGSFAAGILL
ncbi:MAG: cation:proton antiporter, partial [Vampirovibrionia bacterium]